MGVSVSGQIVQDQPAFLIVACIPQHREIQPAPRAEGDGLDEERFALLLIAVEDIPVPVVVPHGRVAVPEGEAGDEPAAVDLFFDGRFCFRQAAFPRPRAHLYAGLAAVREETPEAFDVRFQPIDSAPAGPEIGLHDVGEADIFPAGNLFGGVGVQPLTAFEKGKIDSAVAGGDGGAAA